MRLALALILLALVLIALALAAAWLARRAEPLDYSADEIANAGDVYTGLIAAGCDRLAGNAASAGGDAGGEGQGSCWPFGSCHEDDR